MEIIPRTYKVQKVDVIDIFLNDKDFDVMSIEQNIKRSGKQVMYNKGGGGQGDRQKKGTRFFVVDFYGIPNFNFETISKGLLLYICPPYLNFIIGAILQFSDYFIYFIYFI